MFFSSVVGADSETTTYLTPLSRPALGFSPSHPAEENGLIQTGVWEGRDLELMKNTYQDERGRQPGREAVFGREGGHGPCWLSSKQPPIRAHLEL